MIKPRIALSGMLITLGGVFWLHGCGVLGPKDTIADLNKVELEIKEEYVEDSLEKAMESYQKFLQETPEGALTPEAIRRLADLKIEKEYGKQSSAESSKAESSKAKAAAVSAAGTASVPVPLPSTAVSSVVSPVAAAITAAPIGVIIAKDNKKKEATPQAQSGVIARHGESQKAFEKRASEKQDLAALASAEAAALPEADLQTAGALEAIELYKGLLVKYPYYERNDQVLYQLSRAYEETGQIEKAMSGHCDQDIVC